MEYVAFFTAGALAIVCLILYFLLDYQRMENKKLEMSLVDLGIERDNLKADLARIDEIDSQECIDGAEYARKHFYINKLQVVK